METIENCWCVLFICCWCRSNFIFIRSLRTCIFHGIKMRCAPFIFRHCSHYGLYASNSICMPLCFSAQLVASRAIPRSTNCTLLIRTRSQQTIVFVRFHSSRSFISGSFIVFTSIFINVMMVRAVHCCTLIGMPMNLQSSATSETKFYTNIITIHPKLLNQKQAAAITATPMRSGTVQRHRRPSADNWMTKMSEANTPITDRTEIVRRMCSVMEQQQSSNKAEKNRTQKLI